MEIAFGHGRAMEEAPPHHEAPELDTLPWGHGALTGPGGGSSAALQEVYGHYAESAKPMRDMTDEEFISAKMKKETDDAVENALKKAEQKKAEQEHAAALDKQAEEEAKKDPEYKKDPAAAKKKAAELVDAMDKLKPMFEIVDPKKVGDKKQNQLSDEEFRKVARLYADVKAGKGDLVLDPKSALNKSDQPAIKDKMMNDIAHILQTESGRKLVGALENNVDDKGAHHKTTIDVASDGQNKTTNLAKNPAIAYNAGMLNSIPGAKQDDKDAWASLVRPDVALYHEMVHAYHYAKGDDAPGGMSAKDAVSPNDTTDPSMAAEYQAVGLGPYAHGGKYEKKGWYGKPVNGKPWGDAPFTENLYREERNELTATGAYHDMEPSAAMKAKFPGWKDWWADGQMKDRPQYYPDAA